MREARFKLAINSPMHQRATPLAACGGRVGYPSLFNAARAIGVNQSTLSARENVKMTYRERRPFIMRTPMESTSNGCFRVDFHGALGSRPRLDSARSLVCTMSPRAGRCRTSAGCSGWIRSPRKAIGKARMHR